MVSPQLPCRPDPLCSTGSRRRSAANYERWDTDHLTSAVPDEHHHNDGDRDIDRQGYPKCAWEGIDVWQNENVTVEEDCGHPWVQPGEDAGRQEQVHHGVDTEDPNEECQDSSEETSSYAI